jgi:hypothetical protein
MANNFSGNANCIALWKFENGALLTDSKGANTLTAGGGTTPTADTSIKKEGNASVNYNADGYHKIADASLDAGFPFKNGDSTKKITLCFWMYNDAVASLKYFFGKEVVTTGYSFEVRRDATGHIVVAIGYNSGASQNFHTHATAMEASKWYHIAITFDDATHTVGIRIWDDTAGAILGSDYANTGAQSIYVSNAELAIGARAGDYVGKLNGRLDELVVFNSILSSSDTDKIRAGTYTGGDISGTASPTNSPSASPSGSPSNSSSTSPSGSPSNSASGSPSNSASTSPSGSPSNSPSSSESLSPSMSASGSPSNSPSTSPSSSPSHSASASPSASPSGGMIALTDKIVKAFLIFEGNLPTFTLEYHIFEPEIDASWSYAKIYFKLLNLVGGSMDLKDWGGRQEYVLSGANEYIWIHPNYSAADGDTGGYAMRIVTTGDNLSILKRKSSFTAIATGW